MKIQLSCQFFHVNNGLIHKTSNKSSKKSNLSITSPLFKWWPITTPFDMRKFQFLDVFGFGVSGIQMVNVFLSCAAIALLLGFN